MEQNKTLSILPSGEYRAEPTTKLHSKVFNAFWIIFCGIPFSALNAILGVAYCASILGIPAGIMCFKYIPFIFHPAGREWKLYYGRHPFLNTLNFVFGGLETYIIQFTIGIIYCLTIIGAPLGVQYFKAANFHLAPFGAKVQVADSYTEKLDHTSDYFVLRMQLKTGYEKEVKLSDGSTCQAFNAMYKVVDEKEKKYLSDGRVIGQSKVTIVEQIATCIFASLFVQFLIVLVAFILYATIKSETYTIDIFMKIVWYSNLFHPLYLLICCIIFIPTQIKVSKAFKIFKNKLTNLTTYYPKQYDPKAYNMNKIL